MSEDKWVTIWKTESRGLKGAFVCDVRVNEQGLGDLDQELIKEELGWGMAGKFVQDLQRKIHLLRKQQASPKEREKNARTLAQYVALAGFRPLAIELEHNPYGGAEETSWSWANPKVKVLVPEGYITVHWRNRVIEIDWAGLEDLCDVSAHDKCFKDEDVTKVGRNIHAWGEDDAIRYLTTIRENTIGTNPQIPIFNL